MSPVEDVGKGVHELWRACWQVCYDVHPSRATWLILQCTDAAADECARILIVTHYVVLQLGGDVDPDVLLAPLE